MAIFSNPAGDIAFSLFCQEVVDMRALKNQIKPLLLVQANTCLSQQKYSLSYSDGYVLRNHL